MNDLFPPEALEQALLPVLVAFASLAVSVFRKLVSAEDALHTMRWEIDSLRTQRDELVHHLDGLTQQFAELSARANRLEDRVAETQALLESERKFAQGRIDAESMARKKAEQKAIECAAEIRVLRSEKDALAARLEDQADAHKAQIAALQAQAQRLESESRLLSASIDDRIRAATAHLVAEIETLKTERLALETRIRELESKGADPDA